MNKDTQLIWEAYDNKVIAEVTAGQVATQTGHALLDVLGLVGDKFFGAGFVFDGANAVWYASKKQYLMAAFSIISMVPVIGDIVGKGGKGVVYLARFAKYLKGAGKRGAADKVIKGRKQIENAGKKVKEAQSAIRANRVAIDSVLAKAEENKVLKKHVPEMRAALDKFEAGDMEGALTQPEIADASVPVTTEPAYNRGDEVEWKTKRGNVASGTVQGQYADGRVVVKDKKRNIDVAINPQTILPPKLSA